MTREEAEKRAEELAKVHTKEDLQCLSSRFQETRYGECIYHRCDCDVYDAYVGAYLQAYGEKPDMAVVQFEMNARRIKFILPIAENGKTRTKKNWMMTQAQVEQENRRRWRCLALVIKAKLEAVESGITTLEQEFLAHIVLPNGKTVSEEMVPQIAHAYSTGKMPPLLGYSS